MICQKVDAVSWLLVAGHHRELEELVARGQNGGLKEGNRHSDSVMKCFSYKGKTKNNRINLWLYGRLLTSSDFFIAAVWCSLFHSLNYSMKFDLESVFEYKI